MGPADGGGEHDAPRNLIQASPNQVATINGAGQRRVKSRSYPVESLASTKDLSKEAEHPRHIPGGIRVVPGVVSGHGRLYAEAGGLACPNQTCLREPYKNGNSYISTLLCAPYHLGLCMLSNPCVCEQSKTK